MKKTVALICLLCICLLSFLGCSSNVSAPDASHSAENQYMELFARHAVRNGNYIYFADKLAYDLNGLFVYEIGADKAIPLCSKPECEHNDKSCGAHLIRDENCELTVYDDKLFIFDREGAKPYLYSVNPDGTGYTRVMALDSEYERYFQSLDLLAVYNDTVYRCGYGDKVEHAEAKKTMTLYSMPLGGEESTEILTVENMTQAIERVYEDKIYCAVFTYKGDDVDDGMYFKLDLYCYDMDSAELEKLCTTDVQNCENVLSVVGDKLVFSFGNVWTYSLTTGEIETVKSEQGTGFWLSENRLLKPSGNEYYVVYDLDGNELQSIYRIPEEMGDVRFGTDYVGSCDDVFYFFYEVWSDDPADKYNYIVAVDARKYEAKLLSSVYTGGQVVYDEDGKAIIINGMGDSVEIGTP